MTQKTQPLQFLQNPPEIKQIKYLREPRTEQPGEKSVPKNGNTQVANRTQKAVDALFDAVKMIDNVRHGGQTIPMNERQTRPLSRLKDPGLQQKAWEKAVEIAPE